MNKYVAAGLALLLVACEEPRKQETPEPYRVLRYLIQNVRAGVNDVYVFEDPPKKGFPETVRCYVMNDGAGRAISCVVLHGDSK